MIRRGAGLRADRRDKHEPRNPGLRRGTCEPLSCPSIDAVVQGRIGGAGIRNSGKMDDPVDAGKERLPIEL
jgi:hypothetical protein